MMLRLSVMRPSDFRNLARDVADGRRHEELQAAIRRFLYSDQIDDEATRDLITSVAAELSSHGIWDRIDPVSFLNKGLAVNVGRAHAFSQGLPRHLAFRFLADDKGRVRIERLSPGDEDPFEADGVLDEAVVTVTSTVVQRPPRVAPSTRPLFSRIGTGMIRLVHRNANVRPRMEVLEKSWDDQKSEGI